jgi:hypothetical protein
VSFSFSAIRFECEHLSDVSNAPGEVERHSEKKL